MASPISDPGPGYEEKEEEEEEDTTENSDPGPGDEDDENRFVDKTLIMKNLLTRLKIYVCTL